MGLGDCISAKTWHWIHRVTNNHTAPLPTMSVELGNVLPGDNPVMWKARLQSSAWEDCKQWTALTRDPPTWIMWPPSDILTLATAIATAQDGDRTMTKILSFDGSISTVSEQELIEACQVGLLPRVTVNQGALSKMSQEWLIEFKL